MSKPHDELLIAADEMMNALELLIFMIEQIEHTHSNEERASNAAIENAKQAIANYEEERDEE